MGGVDLATSGHVTSAICFAETSPRAVEPRRQHKSAHTATDTRCGGSWIRAIYGGRRLWQSRTWEVARGMI